MGILEKLMERKHLKSYLDLRIKELREVQLGEIPYQLSDRPQKISEAQTKVKGRIAELKRLREALNQRKLQEESKKAWRILYDNDLVEYDET